MEKSTISQEISFPIYYVSSITKDFKSKSFLSIQMQVLHINNCVQGKVNTRTKVKEMALWKGITWNWQKLDLYTCNAQFSREQTILSPHSLQTTSQNWLELLTVKLILMLYIYFYNISVYTLIKNDVLCLFIVWFTGLVFGPPNYKTYIHSITHTNIFTILSKTNILGIF